MNFKQLIYFTTAAKYMNFGKAAKHIGIAQSALSYGIASLEEEMQVKLFTREGRAVKLTPAGAFFLKEVEAIILKMNSVVEKCRNIHSDIDGTLRIAFLSSIIKRFYSEWIPPFQERVPSAQVIIGQLPMKELRNALINETIDIGITRLFDLRDVSDIEYRILYSDTCSLACHKDNPLASMTTIDYKLLAEEPFIVLSPNSSPSWYHKVSEICHNRGFAPNIVQTPHSMEAIYNLLEFGMGVSIMPSHIKLFDMPNIKMIKLEPGADTRVDVVAAWKKGNTNSLVPMFVEGILLSNHSGGEKEAIISKSGN